MAPGEKHPGSHSRSARAILTLFTEHFINSVESPKEVGPTRVIRPPVLLLQRPAPLQDLEDSWLQDAPRGRLQVPGHQAG